MTALDITEANFVELFGGFQNQLNLLRGQLASLQGGKAISMKSSAAKQSGGKKSQPAPPQSAKQASTGLKNSGFPAECHRGGGFKPNPAVPENGTDASAPAQAPAQAAKKPTVLSYLGAARGDQTSTPEVPTSNDPVVHEETGTKVEESVEEHTVDADEKQIVGLIVKFLEKSEHGVKKDDVFTYVADNLGLTPKEFKPRFMHTFGYYMHNAPKPLLNKLGDPHMLFPVPKKINGQKITLPDTYTGILEMYDRKNNKFIVNTNPNGSNAQTTASAASAQETPAGPTTLWSIEGEKDKYGKTNVVKLGKQLPKPKPNPKPKPKQEQKKKQEQKPKQQRNQSTRHPQSNTQSGGGSKEEPREPRKKGIWIVRGKFRGLPEDVCGIQTTENTANNHPENIPGISGDTQKTYGSYKHDSGQSTVQREPKKKGKSSEDGEDGEDGEEAVWKDAVVSKTNGDILEQFFGSVKGMNFSGVTKQNFTVGIQKCSALYNKKLQEFSTFVDGAGYKPKIPTEIDSTSGNTDNGDKEEEEDEDSNNTDEIDNTSGNTDNGDEDSNNTDEIDNTSGNTNNVDKEEDDVLKLLILETAVQQPTPPTKTTGGSFSEEEKNLADEILGKFVEFGQRINRMYIRFYMIKETAKQFYKRRLNLITGPAPTNKKEMNIMFLAHAKKFGRRFKNKGDKEQALRQFERSEWSFNIEVLNVRLDSGYLANLLLFNGYLEKYPDPKMTKKERLVWIKNRKPMSKSEKQKAVQKFGKTIPKEPCSGVVSQETNRSLRNSLYKYWTRIRYHKPLVQCSGDFKREKLPHPILEHFHELDRLKREEKETTPALQKPVKKS